MGILAQQCFEFGEDLFDGIKVGAVGGRKISLAPALRMARRMSGVLWLLKLSITTISPGLGIGTNACLTQARKLRALMGPSSWHKAWIPSQRGQATKVIVFQLPCGALATKR